jgi:hypothetical protein
MRLIYKRNTIRQLDTEGILYTRYNLPKFAITYILFWDLKLYIAIYIYMYTHIRDTTHKSQKLEYPAKTACSTVVYR